MLSFYLTEPSFTKKVLIISHFSLKLIINLIFQNKNLDFSLKKLFSKKTVASVRI